MCMAAAWQVLAWHSSTWAEHDVALGAEKGCTVTIIVHQHTSGSASRRRPPHAAMNLLEGTLRSAAAASRFPLTCDGGLGAGLDETVELFVDAAIERRARREGLDVRARREVFAGARDDDGPHTVVRMRRAQAVKQAGQHCGRRRS